MLQRMLAALRRLIRPRSAPAAPPGPAPRRQLALRQWIRSAPVTAKTSEERRSMHTAYEKLIQHLDEREITYLTNSDNRSICADFRGAVGRYRIVAVVEPEDSLFQVFGYSPVTVPEGCRPAIAETIARANYGLKVGKFELDYDDGDLRFQVAQILPYDTLEDETIRRLMGTTMAMLDAYLPAVLSVIYANELPKDAIRHAEGRSRGPEPPAEE